MLKRLMAAMVSGTTMTVNGKTFHVMGISRESGYESPCHLWLIEILPVYPKTVGHQRTVFYNENTTFRI